MTLEEFTKQTHAAAYGPDAAKWLLALYYDAEQGTALNDFIKAWNAMNEDAQHVVIGIASNVADLHRQLEENEKELDKTKEDLAAAKKKEDEAYAKAFNDATDIVMRQRDYYLTKATANMSNLSAHGDDVTLALALHNIAFILYQHRDLHPLDRVREELYDAVDASEAAEK